MSRKPIFDAVRHILGRGFTQSEVDTLDKAIDAARAAAPATTVAEAPEKPSQEIANGARMWGTAGARLIKKWEGCEKRRPDGTFTAYADPGSVDGHPWTIGWGSTGSDIVEGLVWTQVKCDARFERDIMRYIHEVSTFLGEAETTQNQFDALVSFHYNTGRIRQSTLGKLHREGKFIEAAKEFAKWIYNDGKPMNGLKSRRADEAKLYGSR